MLIKQFFLWPWKGVMLGIGVVGSCKVRKLIDKNVRKLFLTLGC